MQNLYVVGVGMTLFGRHPDRTVRELTEEAVGTALKDAGCGRDQIQAAYFGNVAQDYFEGQLTIPGQVALLSNGFSGLPIYNVENACATGSTACPKRTSATPRMRPSKTPRKLPGSTWASTPSRCGSR